MPIFSRRKSPEPVSGDKYLKEVGNKISDINKENVDTGDSELDSELDSFIRVHKIDSMANDHSRRKEYDKRMKINKEKINEANRNKDGVNTIEEERKSLKDNAFTKDRSNVENVLRQNLTRHNKDDMTLLQLKNKLSPAINGFEMDGFIDTNSVTDHNTVQGRLDECTLLELLYLKKHDELISSFTLNQILYQEYLIAKNLIFYILKNLVLEDGQESVVPATISTKDPDPGSAVQVASTDDANDDREFHIRRALKNIGRFEKTQQIAKGIIDDLSGKNYSTTSFSNPAYAYTDPSPHPSPTSSSSYRFNNPIYGYFKPPSEHSQNNQPTYPEFPVDKTNESDYAEVAPYDADAGYIDVEPDESYADAGYIDVAPTPVSAVTDNSDA